MIALKDILDKYAYFRLAEKKDNQEILDFFKKIPMESGDLVLRYDRGPDYFDFLNEQGVENFVILFENKDKSIGGISSCSIRNCYDGNRKRTKVAYFGDLRIASTLSKRTRVKWRIMYEELINNASEVDELKECTRIYTAILNQNKSAIKALTKKSNRPIYHHLISYRSVNIIGCFPHIKKVENSRYIASNITEEEYHDLQVFLKDQNENKDCGTYCSYSDFENDELNRRIKVWGKFDIKNFIIVKHKLTGEIVACTCPWQSNNARKLVVEEVSLKYRVLGNIMPLIGGKKCLMGKSMNVLYLTHLEVDSKLKLLDQKDIFRFMLNYLFKSGDNKSSHIVSFIDFSTNSFSSDISPFYIKQMTEGSLYQVISEDDYNLKKYMNIPEGQTVGFELAIG